MPAMDGILLVDKPAGISSFGVVAKVRKVLSQELGRKIKVGHTGTLDPLATGLMILVVGSYTKRAARFSNLDKIYEAEMTLGQTSTTADNEGEKTKTSDTKPDLTEIIEILKQFTGRINQTPPAFSAIKIDGQRAYKLARAGKPVKLKPREVNIYSIDAIDYKYPILKFVTEVSSGTYIRSLAHDIGQALGTGAYLSGLRRVKVGEFDVKDAVNIDHQKLWQYLNP